MDLNILDMIEKKQKSSARSKEGKNIYATPTNNKNKTNDFSFG